MVVETARSTRMSRMRHMRIVGFIWLEEIVEKLEQDLRKTLVE